MKYQVFFSERAILDLNSLTGHTAAILVSWIRKNLERSTEPRRRGQRMPGQPDTHWRYRIGRYRLLTDIQGNSVTILALTCGCGSNLKSEQQL